MKARIQKLRDQSTSLCSSEKRIDIRPRHKKLLAVEGWYTCDDPLSYLPEEYHKLYSEYVEGKAALKFTRWLLRNGYADNVQASRLGLMLTPVCFKLSCRHGDLLRLSETTHYGTCFRTWRGTQQLRFLADPDIAVVYVPDSAGKFKWRAICRLVLFKNSFGLLLYRSYGNANESIILAKLNSIIPLFLSVNCFGVSSFNKEWDKVLPAPKILNSASKCSNQIISHHVWSDHWCALDEKTNRLNMRGIKYS